MATSRSINWAKCFGIAMLILIAVASFFFPLARSASAWSSRVGPEPSENKASPLAQPPPPEVTTQDGEIVLTYRFQQDDVPLIVTIKHRDTGNGPGKMVGPSQEVWGWFALGLDWEEWRAQGNPDEVAPAYMAYVGVTDPSGAPVAGDGNRIGFLKGSWAYASGAGTGFTPKSDGAYTLSGALHEPQNVVFETTIQVDIVEPTATPRVVPTTPPPTARPTQAAATAVPTKVAGKAKPKDELDLDPWVPLFAGLLGAGGALWYLLSSGLLGPLPGGGAVLTQPAGTAEPGPQGYPGANVENPLYSGGVGDHPNTVYEGGDGPGRCGEMGLPNYWVNTATLNLVVQDTIMAYRGLGPAIVLKLTYNSLAAGSGMFGNGWRFSYESAVHRDGETIYVWKGSGQRLSYRIGPAANPVTASAPVEAVSLDERSDRLLDYGQYWLFVEKRSRLMFRYDKEVGSDTSWLTAIFDYNGNAVQLQYTADGMLHSITDAAGRSTRFEYDGNGRCISFSLPDGRTAGFSYDNQGNLVQVDDLLNIPTNYGYDSEGRMTRMAVGRGQRTTKFAYRGRDGLKQVSAVTDAGGNTTRYDVVSVNPAQVRVTDPEGHTTQYHSVDGRTARIVDALGNTTAYEYAKGLRVSVQDRNGQVSGMEYDGRGNMTKHTDALGNATVFVFDDYDNLISATNRMGETWSCAYDERHNLIKLVSPMGDFQLFDYDDKGQLVAVTDPNGNKQTLDYDGFGNVIAVTNALGNTIRMSYKQYGLTKAAMTDARGNTTRFEYDSNNRLTKVTHPDETFRTHGYDCCAEISMTDENKNPRSVVRSPLMDIQERLDPIGSRTHYEYAHSHRRNKAIDALGRSTTWTYDAGGRVIQMLDPAEQTVRMRYDPEGNLISLWDERGKQTRLAYDPRSLRSATRDSLGHAGTIARDALGRWSTYVNARGQQISFTYNSDGELTGKYFDGVQVGTYEYDAAGNLTKVTDVTGITTYKYSAVNQVTSIRYPDGLEILFSYDEESNISSITYPGGGVVEYAYDNRNRVVGAAWKGGRVSRRYDAASNLMSESRSNGTESAYTYNANNELVEVRHRKGAHLFAHRIYTRDAVGGIVQESGILPVEPSLDSVPASYTYNDANQILSDGSGRYTYDADGNLTDISGGKWQAVYDAQNRPVEITRNGRTTEYTYNGLNRRTKAATGSSVRQYYYDQMGRLMFEADGSGQVVAWNIYIGHLVLARVNPLGESQFYHFDKTGNTLAVTDDRGDLAAAYAYEPFGAQAKRTGNIDNPFTYVGAHGVMDEGGGLFFMRTRYYDAITGRFLQKDPIGISGGTNLYAYVGNNPVRLIDPLGLQGDYIGHEGQIVHTPSETSYPSDIPKASYPGAPHRAHPGPPEPWSDEALWFGRAIDEGLTYTPYTSVPYGLTKGAYYVICGDPIKGMWEMAKTQMGPVGTAFEFVEDTHEMCGLFGIYDWLKQGFEENVGRPIVEGLRALEEALWYEAFCHEQEAFFD